MNIQDIEAEWAKDAEIDEMDLGGAALNIPKLHSKYLGYLSRERLVLIGHKNDLDKLCLILEQYFAKTLTDQELLEYNLPPYSEKRILRTDVQKYVDTHKDVVAQKLKIGIQVEKIKYLEDVIKMIHSRNYQVKSAIDWAKFAAGV